MTKLGCGVGGGGGRGGALDFIDFAALLKIKINMFMPLSLPF